MKDQHGIRPIKMQLQAFYYSLVSQGMKQGHVPKDWLEAFFLMETFLKEIDDGSKQIIFLDELPWMDTPKSGFITALESFWNSWACHRNILLIVSGSATSWIENRLINNHGGLYGRVTYEIKLDPFSLRECELLYRDRGINFSRYDIVQSYMIFGGMPFYMDYVRRGQSLAQSIDELFFLRGAKLRQEYDRLFSSVFVNPNMMKSIVSVLSEKNKGCTRSYIAQKSGYSEGGTLTDALNNLISSDFVIKYVPFGSGKREARYKLIDPFCIFYLRFVEKSDSLTDGFWQQNITSQPIVSWRGYAFENVCFCHIPQIKKALGISGISSSQAAWTNIGDNETNTQIDMIISRTDNAVNMCEMKFYSDIFTVDKSYDMLLRKRKTLLSEKIPKKSHVLNTLITTYGIKENEYKWTFDNIITMDELFAS